MVFLFGILGLLNAKLLLVIFIIISAASIIHTVYSKPRIFPAIKFPNNLYLWLIIPFLILSFLATTYPEIFYDSLTYHLAIPQIYLQEGRIVNLPLNIYSAITNLIAYIYTWGLVLGGVYTAKLINFGFGLILVWLIFISGRELASILFISIPLAALNFWCAGSDTGMTLFLLTGLTLFYAWATEEDRSNSFLYLSALLLGFAVSSKYTAGLGIPFLIVTIILSGKNSGLKKYKTLILFILLIILPLIPWWIKNYIYTGNPFFPFLTGIFGTGQWSPDSVLSFKSEVRHGYNGLSTILNGLLGIAKTSISGAGQGRAGFTGPVLILLLPFILLNLNEKKIRMALYYFCTAVLFWLFSTHMVRHLIPHLTVLIIAVSLAIEKNTKLKLLFSLIAFISIYWIISVFQIRYDGLKVLTGQWSPDEYLLREHTSIYYNPSYSGYKFIEKNIPDRKARILIVGDARQFYCPNPAISNTVHDTPVFFDIVSRENSVEGLKEWFKSENISYLMINWGETRRLTPKTYMGNKPLKIVQKFLKFHTNPVFNNQRVTICKVNY